MCEVVRVKPVQIQRSYALLQIPGIGIFGRESHNQPKTVAMWTLQMEELER